VPCNQRCPLGPIADILLKGPALNCLPVLGYPVCIHVEAYHDYRDRFVSHS
jgi:hypothetical protein